MAPQVLALCSFVLCVCMQPPELPGLCFWWCLLKIFEGPGFLFPVLTLEFPRVWNLRTRNLIRVICLYTAWFLLPVLTSLAMAFIFPSHLPNPRTVASQSWNASLATFRKQQVRELLSMGIEQDMGWLLLPCGLTLLMMLVVVIKMVATGEHSSSTQQGMSQSGLNYLPQLASCFTLIRLVV